MEKKSQRLYATDYNLLIVQDLWQIHYQILSKILLQEFIITKRQNVWKYGSLKTKFKTIIKSWLVQKKVYRVINHTLI